jgi:hypothetical protein
VKTKIKTKKLKKVTNKKKTLKKVVTKKKPIKKNFEKPKRKKRLKYTKIDMSTMEPLPGFSPVYTFRRIP